jgi:hypothetical protein
MTPEVPMNACFATPPAHPTAEVSMKKIRRRVLTPKSLFHGLAHELDLLTVTYARFHTAHPVLTPYPTLPPLLARLTTGPRDDAKNELLAALITIRQASPHRLWVAILLRAFRPMLGKLWKDLFGSDSEERLALLILSFQEALGRVDATRDPLRIGMYVRQATRRKVIEALTDEIQWGEVGFGEDAEEVASSHDPPPRERLRDARKLLGRGALLAHVRRSHPGRSSAEHARIYGTLRRALRRVFPQPAVQGAP